MHHAYLRIGVEQSSVGQELRDLALGIGAAVPLMQYRTMLRIDDRYACIDVAHGDQSPVGRDRQPMGHRSGQVDAPSLRGAIPARENARIVGRTDDARRAHNPRPVRRERKRIPVMR